MGKKNKQRRENKKSKKRGSLYAEKNDKKKRKISKRADRVR